MHRLVELYTAVSCGSDVGSMAQVAVNSLTPDLGSFTFQEKANVLFELKLENGIDANFFSVQLNFGTVQASGSIQASFTLANSPIARVLDANSEKWTGFRFALSQFSAVNTFNVSSLSSMIIGYGVSAGGSASLMQARNAYIEYGDEVSEDIQFTLVASGSNNAIGIMPEHDYRKRFKYSGVDHRLLNGDLYSYQFSGFNSYSIGARYFPHSSAMCVNSMWNNFAPSFFFASFSYDMQLDRVKIMSADAPFSVYENAYYGQLMRGTIDLEGF